MSIYVETAVKHRINEVSGCSFRYARFEPIVHIAHTQYLFGGICVWNLSTIGASGESKRTCLTKRRVFL